MRQAGNDRAMNQRKGVYGYLILITHFMKIGIEIV